MSEAKDGDKAKSFYAIAPFLDVRTPEPATIPRMATYQVVVHHRPANGITLEAALYHDSATPVDILPMSITPPPGPRAIITFDTQNNGTSSNDYKLVVVMTVTATGQKSTATWGFRPLA